MRSRPSPGARPDPGLEPPRRPDRGGDRGAAALPASEWSASCADAAVVPEALPPGYVEFWARRAARQDRRRGPAGSDRRRTGRAPRPPARAARSSRPGSPGDRRRGRRRTPTSGSPASSRSRRCRRARSSSRRDVPEVPRRPLAVRAVSFSFALWAWRSAWRCAR